MSTNRNSEAAALRQRLQHPVIDSDGHWVEFGPDAKMPAILSINGRTFSRAPGRRPKIAAARHLRR